MLPPQSSSGAAPAFARRARAAQMHLVRFAYGCGRSGSAAADDASETLQQVIDTLSGVK